MKVGTKLIAKRIVYLGIMGAVVMRTNPNSGFISYQFWIWFTIFLFMNIVLPSLILEEETFEFFNLFSIENFKSAPISGVALIILILIFVLALFSSPYWIYKAFTL